MNQDDIRKLLEEEDKSCSDLEDFASGSSDNFVPSENYKSSSSSAEDLDNDNINEDIGDINEFDTNTLDCDQPHDENFDWKSPEDFVPKRTASTSRNCKISSDIPRTASIGDIFQKLIPKSVYMYIAQCTNERIQILESEQSARKKQKLTRTNAGEIKVIVGCMFIMCYNRLPCVKDYWSLHKSLGNKSIQEAIARHRFLFITSKMYFACPEKPLDCSKTYYLDDLVECLKKTFQKCRQDSSFQSIDESMTKFKGRSSLKQYMPLKPVKRGIKMWLRCDAVTGYTYDFNIYCGKDLEEHSGTLGERVVTKLISSIAENDVTLCFDRFFTSVNLLNTLPYPAVGTTMRNRKNVPEFTSKKLERGEAEFKCLSNRFW